MSARSFSVLLPPKAKTVDVTVLDWYNIFSSVVKLKKSDKTKHFSEKSFVETFEMVAKNTQAKHHYLVSKEIFEVSKATIKRMTKAHPNVTYIIVKDLLVANKGKNRARDDYFLFVLEKTLRKKVKSLAVVSRDKYSDYHATINNTLPIEIATFKGGAEKISKMDAARLEKEKLVFKGTRKPAACGYSIRK